MRSTLSLVLVVCIAGWSLPASAQQLLGHAAPDRVTPAPMSGSARLALTQQSQPTAQKATRQNWIHRHPVATGALIGFGVGFAVGAATCKYPGAEGGSSCATWTYPGNARMLGGVTFGSIGAGIGALIGAAFGR
jgi:hypothetical protein